MGVLRGSVFSTCTVDGAADGVTGRCRVLRLFPAVAHTGPRRPAVSDPWSL